MTCVGGFLFSEQILLAGLGGSNFSAIFIMKSGFYISEEIRLLLNRHSKGFPIFVLDDLMLGVNFFKYLKNNFIFEFSIPKLPWMQVFMLVTFLFHEILNCDLFAHICP